jgi:CxxC motif-containing protein (DUF1111 family)
MLEVPATVGTAFLLEDRDGLGQTHITRGVDRLEVVEGAQRKRGVDFLEFDYSSGAAVPARRNAAGVAVLAGTPLTVLSMSDLAVSVSVVQL